jgi:DNA-directed RNA polymerase subunit N (RpoN/RPB10)
MTMKAKCAQTPVSSNLCTCLVQFTRLDRFKSMVHIHSIRNFFQNMTKERRPSFSSWLVHLKKFSPPMKNLDELQVDSHCCQWTLMLLASNKGMGKKHHEETQQLIRPLCD